VDDEALPFLAHEHPLHPGGIRQPADCPQARLAAPGLQPHREHAAASQFGLFPQGGQPRPTYGGRRPAMATLAARVADQVGELGVGSRRAAGSSIRRLTGLPQTMQPQRFSMMSTSRQSAWSISRPRAWRRSW
jgi:hypothetical protein